MFVTRKSAEQRLAKPRWSPYTLLRCMWLGRVQRVREQVDDDSSKFQLVGLPIEATLSAFGKTGKGEQCGTISLRTADSLIMNVSIYAENVMHTCLYKYSKTRLL